MSHNSCSSLSNKDVTCSWRLASQSELGPQLADPAQRGNKEEWRKKVLAALENQGGTGRRRREERMMAAASGLAGGTSLDHGHPKPWQGSSSVTFP